MEGDGMTDELYSRLREFFDGLPGGFPATESGVEIKILQRYFTPREAEMVMNMEGYPETPAAIAERAGIEEAEAAELLESMAARGNIFRVNAGEDKLYMAMSFLVGMYEFHLNSMDRELAELYHEYFPNLSKAQLQVKTKQHRIVPVEAAISSKKEVATYDRIREMVRNYTDIAVADCICRVEQGLLGHECERPIETCLMFGAFATEYYVENGLGRRISIEECLEMLDRAEENALVLYPSNSQDMINICCCCSCCCHELKALKMFDRPADFVLSTYQASIDRDECNACGTCLERCQMEAIIEGDEYMEVDLARCIGCGLCSPTCPSEAIAMIPKAQVETPPANVLEMNANILQDRGLA
jgi:electron transport complex protein RnfB